MEKIYLEVGRQVRARRLQQQLTLEDLSELSGMHPSYIGQIERGVKKSSLKSLSRLAQSLGLPAGKFFLPAAALETSSLGSLIDAASRGNNAAEKKIMLAVLRNLAKSLREHRPG